MDRIVDETGIKIAGCIRAERETRDWSLADLAERSGVSRATISKIERQEMSPSAVILVRLASAFDLTLAGLLLLAEGERARLSRANEQPIWRDPETGYLRKQVFRRPDHPLELVSIELPAGKRLTYPAWTYAHIRQIIWVQTGDLVILEGDQKHLLRPGDCLGFGPPSEVTLANESRRACTYVLALARN